MNLNHQIEKQIKVLRLEGLISSLDLRLQQAQSSTLGYLEFLQLLVQDEIERREARKLTLRLSRASFEEEKTLEGFDFSFNPKLNARLIRDLATCVFIEKREHVPSMALLALERATSPMHWAIRPAERATMCSLPRPQNSFASCSPHEQITPGKSELKNTWLQSSS